MFLGVQYCSCCTVKKTMSLFSHMTEDIPSTRDVSRVTFAAFLRPAGKLRPIFSSLSLKDRPPFFDLALQENDKEGYE